ncbi:hypothetical protein [Maricaulis sp.]|uniref:hypothetical protein n=1 Tax=Maricaulis sp. TaxID=1486257 RepID=UPI0025BE31CE|nr:hypothetical protein [Maricaulis sp.]
MSFSLDWFEVQEVQAAGFEDELRRECVPGHVLYGLEVRAVATADWSDDALFEQEDGRWALVHLAWRTETDPKWPGTAIYPDLESVPKQLHSEFEARPGRDLPQEDCCSVLPTPYLAASVAAAREDHP